MRYILFLLIFSLAASALAQTKLELRDKDRVLFLGDALLEREDTYGFLEANLTAAYAKKGLMFRNLSWSGDTPLGVSRASFDPPAKGWERLREQIADVKATVAILGFGMAASLQELAERSGDPMLNLDPARCGREPMTAARFKAEMGQLLDEFKKSGVDRVVMLAPLRHEDLRDARPQTPDPAAHQKLLDAYTQALQELANERRALFIAASTFDEPARPRTSDGIHLTEAGYKEWVGQVMTQLRWPEKWITPVSPEVLRPAIIRKNQLFFHRWRPQNYTYLFGFRKKEQGQNAREIPLFDPLIEKAEAEIARLTSAPPPGVGIKIEMKPVALPDAPALPTFDVQPGYKIELWATNPLLEKPIQMNWDSDGRLWIASSSTYPQVNPEDVAAKLAGDLAAGPSAGNDRIIILEASKPGGPPDKSTVFADGLLIPTGVAPFRTKNGHWGCYVGQSTELLELVDTDDDGKADRRRVVLSGFGTEDTHHLIHTLKWGPDGQLYFNQSIYIHSHLETPWGLVRLNSGGVLSWNPESERVDVHFKGFCNPWGHVWDKQGQSFVTDGAGFQGVSWGVEGAMYFTYENGRKLMPSISPGSYPKFASLEYIDSPHFPADWQGSLVTCDFRAHRIVHFGLNDLTTSQPAKAGYVTTELPDLVRTSDLSFRPIDVRLGPDGALYVADWSNPVINHGEVDFRDPRRDHHMGRIWKITRDGTALLPWEKLTAKSEDALLEAAVSSNAWTARYAVQQLQQTGHIDVLSISATHNNIDPRWPGVAENDLQLASFSRNRNPRVRLEAMRMLARLPSLPNIDLALAAALDAPPEDPFYEYAAWLTMNDLAPAWTKAVLAGEWKPESPEREKQLAFALQAIEPALAGPVLTKVLEGRALPADGSGPWIELIGKAGGPAELEQLFSLVLRGEASPAVVTRGLAALGEAMRLRSQKPAIDLGRVEKLLTNSAPEVALAAVQLVAAWKLPKAAALLAALTRDSQPESVRRAAILGLRELGGREALEALSPLCVQRPLTPISTQAVIAVGWLDLPGSFSLIAAWLRDAEGPAQLEAWRGLLAGKGVPEALASRLAKPDGIKLLSPATREVGGRVAGELGAKGRKLAALLSPAGTAPATTAPDYATTAQLVVRDGDPARGEEIYRRANLLCTTCHAIGGAGGKVGPDLTSLGASAPLDYIIESVVAPAAKVKEGYHAVSVTLKDGGAALGIPSRETGEELFLRDVSGHETAVVKAKIAGKELVGSLMPAGLAEQLQGREKLDLYAFLSQLGKPGVYDASKGNVARYWALYPASALDGYLSGGELPAPAAPAYTLVDGRLTREMLSAAVESIPGDTFLAAIRVQNPPSETKSGPPKADLTIRGASEAWFDRAPLSGKVSHGPGEHTIVVRLAREKLPELLKAESVSGRFLGN